MCKCGRVMESKIRKIDTRTTKNVQKCEDGKSWTPFLRQLFVASGAWTCYFSVGLCTGTPTVMMPQLRKEANNTEVISEEWASWIPALYSYFGLPWVFILPIILKYYGRKKTYIFVSVVTLIGFIISYASKNLTVFIISEIAHGPNSASHFTTAVILITEYISPKYRGIFLTLKSATFFWGLWVANAIGTFAHWKTIALLGIACSIYCLMIVAFWPESPYWLAANGKFEDCSKSYRWLNGTDEESERNLQKMIDYQKELQKIQKSSISSKSSIKNVYSTIRRKQFYKPVLLSGLNLCLYMFSGKLVISIYAVEILSKITDKSAVYSGMLILDAVTVFSMYIGSILSKVFKRRTLLITASSFAILFLFILSLYFFLIKSSVFSEDKYASIILLLGFSISISCGPMILSSTISSELISLESRNLSICFIALTFKLLNGTLVKVSPYIFKSCGMHGAFLFYGTTSLFFLILIYKFLPETKDKTLQEIAEMIIGKKNKTEHYEFKEMMPIRTS